MRVLERQGSIVGISDGHYRRYFSRELVLPAESRRLSEEDRRLLAECRRPMSLAIVLNLAVEGRLRQADLRERLGKSKSTISYHLSRLVTSGHVRLVLDSYPDAYEIADRVRSVVSSIGKLDPDWTPAVAYEQAQERLLLWILLGDAAT